MPYKDFFQRFIFTPNRRTAVLAVLVAVGIGIVFLTVQRQSPAEWRDAAAGGEGLTVMTFNISLGGRPAAAALDGIKEANSDIICIQEMTPSLAVAFEKRFSALYPYRLLLPGSSVHGIGIASKFPLSNEAIIREGMSHLPVASASAALGDGLVRIACVHLIPPHARPQEGETLWQRYFRNKGTRIIQAGIVIDSLAKAGGPAIILGDMNEWSGQTALSLFNDAGFADACESRPNRCGASWPGEAMTFPALFQIDHILGRDVRFADAAVLGAGGSDHYPVAARVIVGPRQFAEGNAQ